MSSCPTPIALCRFAAALLVAGTAVAHAQSGLVARSGSPDEGIKPEASFSERIDPWSRWTLRLHADPALGNAAAARADVDVRFLTERLDGHQLQAGAAMSLSPTAADQVVQAWQPFEGDAPSLFVKDSWRWSSQVSLSAGARLVNMAAGAAYHQRLSLAWQPLSDWTLRLTDGALRMVSPPAEGLRVQRFQGVELQTEQSAGIVKVEAKLASQLVNEVTQPQVLHAASVTLSAPIDDHWTVGGDSLITSQGNLMRFKLSGTMANDKAKLSLVVPRRTQGRPVDPALNGGLPLVDAADSLGWRTQLEVRF